MTAPQPDRPTHRRFTIDAAGAAQVATFAALIAALGLAPPLHPFGLPVPITLQTLGVMLAGAVLGARRGTLAVVTFLVLVASGLPLLSGGRGGFGVFLEGSGGYLVGWVLGAWVVGAVVERAVARGGTTPSFRVVLTGALVGGVVVVYAFGIPGVTLSVGTPLRVAAVQALLFVPGDVLKALLTASVAVAVARAHPRTPVLLAALRWRTAVVEPAPEPTPVPAGAPLAAAATTTEV